MFPKWNEGGIFMAKLGRGIYYRKNDNRYMGKCRAGRDENNKIIYAYVYDKSLKIVTEKLEAKRLAVSHQRNVRVHKDGSVREWLLWYVFNLRNVKQSTVTTYYAQATNHIIPILGELKLCSLTTEQVQDFINALMNKGISAVTIKNIYGFLRMVIEKAEKKNMLFANPCKDIRLPALAPRQTIPLTQKQQYMLEKSNDIAVIIPLFTGIRLGELCALRIENVDLKAGVIRIDSTMQRVRAFDKDNKTELVITPPKSKNSARIIPLPECLIELLKRHIKANKGYLLTNSGDYMIPRTLQNHFKRLLKACGLADTNFHSLRHTFATRCLENNMDIKTLSEVLGHANASVTMNIYCHSCDEHKRNCMNKLTFMKAS